ncbi:putative membrane protein [Ehrlichia chaffeensis str. Heartland]|uniref:hypothetical protein n=1 Tax=Ehrlichia chaffeensis TaxID=945 RepID=UPI000444D7CC|nr:hypothetical protein [Ehrlichia chaffeensis]AHX03749.1 putative membrane protein [Ehrlichia chaffeensis str. Heartland]AHX08182.1 putative membrane protein [Ehrlichia chaffeensis str. Saint Vincent]AHX09585.1 putative membrane protein [Ehrlichia chaffeensis str. Wakulla]AHX10928.1 putative membrane protein [Ehrlichia chaffeensis str. West Paces]
MIKIKASRYTKIHLIAIAIILSLWNVFFIIKLISSIPQHIKNLIFPYTAILSISSLLLYGINIIYNLNIMLKYHQGKIELQKKSLFSYLGVIGEATSLLALNIISTIAILILPMNKPMIIVASIFNILSSLFVIEYASIFLNTDIKNHKQLKNTNKSTKYTTWSIINWSAALIISIANVSFTFTGYFIKHNANDIFKIILFTVYISIITSLIFMRNMRENDPSILLNAQVEPTRFNTDEEREHLLKHEEGISHYSR